MSLSCAVLIGPIVLFKDNAFLGTSAHESVAPAGYLRATCWPLVERRDLAKRWRARAKWLCRYWGWGVRMARYGRKMIEDEPILTKNTSDWRDFGEKYVRMARFSRKIRQHGAILMKNA